MTAPRILTLDIASSTGWAYWDTEGHEASMKCGAIYLGDDAKDEDTGMAKRREMRRALHAELTALYREYRPNLVCLEQPLNYIKQGSAGKKMPLFRGDAPAAGKPEKGGPNASTVLLLNQLFAAADEFFWQLANPIDPAAGKLTPFYMMEVAPKSWQVLTKDFPGGTKDRSIAFCHLHQITIPSGNQKVRGDAADACVMAVWADGELRRRKLEQQARAQYQNSRSAA